MVGDLPPTLTQLYTRAFPRERELVDGDFTAGIVIEALTRGIVTLEDFCDPEVAVGELVERIHSHGIEDSFLDEWTSL